jgi:5-methylcytosine-specific restriction endonuclease McrA
MVKSHHEADGSCRGVFRALLTTISQIRKREASRQTREPSSKVVTSEKARAKWQRAGQKRRMLEKESGLGFTDTDFEDLCERYGGRCLCCGGKLDLVADHVVPLSKGGMHSIGNIQPLCRACNSRKHTLTVDFRKVENRFSFFVGKSGSKRHIVGSGKTRTLCGLHADEQVEFSEAPGELPLCRKCGWSLRGELERLHIK